MQIAIVEREQLTDALFKRKPAVFDGVQIRGVRRQEFLSAARACNELASFGGLMKTRVVVDHHLPGFEDWHPTVLDLGFKERGVAGPLEDEGRDQVVVVERIKQTHPLRAMAGLLPPARFALGAPAISPGFMIIHPRLIQIDQLLSGHSSQLGAKLLPQRFVSFGIAKGLFLCVSPSLRSCRQIVMRFTPPHASANSSKVASP